MNESDNVTPLDTHCVSIFFFFLDSITLPFQKNNQLIWVLITSQIKKDMWLKRMQYINQTFVNYI